MGWCDATSIFDRVAEQVIDKPEIPVKEQVNIIVAIMDQLTDMDWDCEAESKYHDHPVFITAEFELFGQVTRYDDELDTDVDVFDKVLTEHLSSSRIRWMKADQEDRDAQRGE